VCGFNGDLFIVHGSAHIATDELSDTLIATAPDPDSTAPRDYTVVLDLDDPASNVTSWTKSD